jgi:hypothetical protein
MLTANSAAILTDAFPSGQRGFALGTNQVAAIVGQFIGLVAGGVRPDHRVRRGDRLRGGGRCRVAAAGRTRPLPGRRYAAQRQRRAPETWRRGAGGG